MSPLCISRHVKIFGVTVSPWMRSLTTKIVMGGGSKAIRWNYLISPLRAIWCTVPQLFAFLKSTYHGGYLFITLSFSLLKSLIKVILVQSMYGRQSQDLDMKTKVLRLHYEELPQNRRVVKSDYLKESKGYVYSGRMVIICREKSRFEYDQSGWNFHYKRCAQSKYIYIYIYIYTTFSQ